MKPFSSERINAHFKSPPPPPPPADADWNERGWSAAYVKALRSALDGAGFASVKILCGDDAHEFACASSVASDPSLAAVVDVLGSHNPTTVPPATAGKSLWGSELEVADDGGSDTPANIASLYLNFNVTGFIFWSVVTAYYEGIFAWDQGAFLAAWPWAGYYELSGRMWAVAHFTQHVPVGARVLLPGSGAGQLTSGGTYLAFVDAAGAGELTVVVHKPLTAAAETAAFAISGPAAGITALHAWRSQTQTGRGADLSKYYLAVADVPVTGGTFSLDLAPGDIWTLTTRTGGAKGVRLPPPPFAPFPGAYADNFDTCPLSQEAPYWTDMTGAWECVNSGDASRGVVMRQVVPEHPIAWRPDEQRPVSVLGDINWAAADISVDVRMPAAGDGALLGVRANPNCCGRVITGEDMMPGLWLAVTAGSQTWTAYNAIANVSKAGVSGGVGGGSGSAAATGVLASGTLAAAPVPGGWLHLRVAIDASGSAQAEVGGISVFSGLLLRGKVPDTGFVGIGTIDWGHFVDFDNVTVTAAEQT